MSSNQQYRNMLDLAAAIKAKIEKLDDGSISEDELSETLEETRALYDRLVVVQYKAFESSVKGRVSEKTATKEVEVEPEFSENDHEEEATDQPVRSEETDLFGGFKFTLNSPKSVDNDLKSEQKPKPSIGKKMPGKQESIPMPEQPLPFNNPNPPKSVDVAPVETQEEEIQEIPDKNQTNLIDQIEDTPAPKSLNDQLAANQSGDNLAKKLAMQPIDNLKTAIGINQKFLFMNDLFKGEHTDFHAVLDRLDAMNESNEAMTYLAQLKDQYNWDMESESALNFTELVERRFL